MGGADDALCLAADQRGVARTTDCESGAVEITATHVPTPIFVDGFLQGDTRGVERDGELTGRQRPSAS